MTRLLLLPPSFFRRINLLPPSFLRRVNLLPPSFLRRINLLPPSFLRRVNLPLLLLLAQRLSAQAPFSPHPVVPDERLYAAVDSIYVETIRRENPTLLLRWNFYLDNAFIISDFPSEKGNVEQYPLVKIPDMENLNILVLEKEQRLSRDWQKPVFYHIEGTNKVLMYFSGMDFNRKFREWLARKQ